MQKEKCKDQVGVSAQRKIAHAFYVSKLLPDVVKHCDVCIVRALENSFTCTAVVEPCDVCVVGALKTAALAQLLSNLVTCVSYVHSPSICQM
jgi:hypothetical protein